MPRRIVIHAGFHKTGTSSVQRGLRRHRNTLRPFMKSVLKGSMTELLHATRGYSTWRDTGSRQKVRRRFTALLETARDMPRRTLCLSAEELSGHMPGRPGLTDYAAAPDLATDFAQIAHAVFPDCPVCFFYTTRSAESWLESAYWEHVKSSSMTSDLDSFVAAHASAADFDRILDAVAQAQPHAVHQASLTETDPQAFAALLSLCDVPAEVITQLPPIPPQNARLPQAVLQALLAANRTYSDRDARKAAKARILADLEGQAS